MSPGPIPNFFVTSSSVRSAVQSSTKEAVSSGNEILFLQEIEDIANLAVNLGDFTGEGEECAVEKCEEVLLGIDVTGRHAREDVHAESGFRPQLRFDGLRFAEEIFLHQLVDLVNVLREDDGLPVLVVPRAARAAAHLLDFEDGNRRQAEVDVISIQVSD